MKITHALICPVEQGCGKPLSFRVCGSSNGRFTGNPKDDFSWLGKSGWIPIDSLPGTQRKHSTFSTIQRARIAAIKAGASSITIP